ncbi:MAG: Na+/H+ antiporter subunit E [Pseudomonadota bacterium]
MIDISGWPSLLRALFIFISLFALWLLLSGLYKPILISFGVISSALVTWVVYRLGLMGRRGLFNHLKIVAFFRYLFWLTVEVGKADWAVTKVILSPTLPKRQRLIRVPCKQHSDVARMIYANSITLTPGTVTVETEEDYVIVHALTDEAADAKGLAAMGDRVSAMERATTMRRALR